MTTPAADPVRARVEALAARTGTVAAPDAWAPHPGPQEQFLSLGCFEALYGGAAGGGKSDALLAGAVRPIIERRGHGRGWLALLLRRTFPELETNLVRRSHELYPRLGGRWSEGKHAWTFPGGETVLFGHLEYEKDVHRYQGSAFTFVGLDELTTFTEYQYLYLFSRVRSAQGIPCRVRAASNPGGVGHGWVRKRWFDWVSRKSTRPARPGAVRHYRRVGDQDTLAARGDDGALGRTFVPAKLTDNPSLAGNDPGYRARLGALPRLDRLRLEHGDWDVEPAQKDYYDRAKVRILRARPARDEVAALGRGWDFGATEDGDFSAGVLGAWLRAGIFAVLHVARFQGAPDKLHAEFERWAVADRAHDPRAAQCIPQDPGAAGKLTVADFHRRYPGLAIVGRRPTGDKATRFRAPSSRALAGNYAVVDDGTWDVGAYHDELEAFPLGTYDDQVDATSDAYALATGDVPATLGEVAVHQPQMPRTRY